MEDHYEALRRQARDKRDKIIQKAQDDYRVAVKRINALRKHVTGKARPVIKPVRQPGEKTLHEVLLDVLPKDRAYTFAEARDIAFQHPLGSSYRENSVRSAMQNMVTSGILHRVGRSRGHVLWAFKNSAVEVSPFAAKTMAQIILEVIHERGPMRVTELTVLLKERGYRPEEPKQTTYNTILAALTRFNGRFMKDAVGRWGVGSDSA